MAGSFFCRGVQPSWSATAFLAPDREEGEGRDADGHSNDENWWKKT